MPPALAANSMLRAVRRLATVAAEVSREAQTTQPNIAAMVCVVVAQACTPIALSSAAWDWVHSQLPLPGVDSTIATALEPLCAAVRAQLATIGESADPLAIFYEEYLAAANDDRRMRHGVFYTPQEVARFVVRSIDQQLREEFAARFGIADSRTWNQALHDGSVSTLPRHFAPNSPWLRILDPALGAGLFLTTVIEHIHDTLTTAWRNEGRSTSAWQHAWNDYVARHLLPRLGAYEIIPEACYLALVRIACVLTKTGYRFENSPPLQLHIGDALAAPIRPPWTLILGNPPFSGISSAKQPWLQALLRGVGPSGEARANYFDVAGQALGERKHWLQDDYVKFFRVAHEQIEQIGVGVVALVTNHGYLDNVSFRGMREKLAQTFPRMTLIDLHGNAKRRERTPQGERDENVFGIEQGVAIGLLRRPGVPLAPRSERIDIWGSRSEKLALLATAEIADLPRESLNLSNFGAPFIASLVTSFPEYDAGWSLAEIFPWNTTAPVTARDDFVVAFEAAELLARWQDLANPAHSDDELRARYFQSSRSRSYPPGDTRGWKLPAARQWIQSQTGPESYLAKVQYRPFDLRALLWARELIDWPRYEVMQHLQTPGNLALIARRQAPPGRAYSYAWITDTLALDGVIRSDNCGSESIFPLWRWEHGQRQANITTGLLEQHFPTASPEQLLHYVYALLWSPGYRLRYAARLARDFPRVLRPRSLELFEQLAALGQQLIDLHLLRVDLAPKRWALAGEPNIATGMPRYRDGVVQLNPVCQLGDVSPAAWEFTVGSHQVLRKYLRDRRGRVLTTSEQARYALIASAIEATLAVQTEIDAAISSHGGLAAAFTS